MDPCWSNCVLTGTNVATLRCFECIFQSILNVAVQLAGVVAFVMIIVGGFQLLTAGGDPKKAQTAKNTITFAVVGLVLLIVAWLILKFIEDFTGVKVTIFRIGS